MLRRKYSPTWFALTLGCLLVASLAQEAAAGPVGIRLHADPDRVPADGESQVAISAEVMEASGVPVADGTPVYFVATLGEIVSPVETIGGFAQTVLTASNAAGTAIVSAIVGGARESISVEFVAEPGSATPGSRMVTLTGEDVSYSADLRTFVIVGGAELRYQSVVIRADGLQHDVNSNVVCAQGNVVLLFGDRRVEADALRYELVRLRGRLVRVTDEVERLVVEGERLETRADPSDESCLWEPLRTDTARTWVKARRAIVDPGNKVILDDAAFYVDETRVMSLRRHVLDPRSGSAVFGNALGFSTTTGVDLDFPYYYRASAHQVGSLHLTRNRNVGPARYEPGWAVGLQEEYVWEGRSDGSFSLDDVTRPARGLHWQHRQNLGAGGMVHADTSVMSFDEDEPRLRTSAVSFFRPMGGGSLSLGVSGSDFGTSEEYASNLNYRFRGSRIGSGTLVTPALHLRHSRSYSEEDALLIDPQTGEPFHLMEQRMGRSTSASFDLNFDLPSRELGEKTKISANLLTGYAWRFSGGSRGVLETRLALDRRVGREGRVGLSYTYSSSSAGVDSSLFSAGNNLLSLSAQGRVRGCFLRARLSQDLGRERRFGSIHLSRALPFGSDPLGRPLWNVEVGHFFSRLESYGAASTRFALNRRIGRYQASLCYSPQGVGDYGSRPWISPVGFGYTYSGGRHLWVELSAAAF
jgi:hypothetical protein